MDPQPAELTAPPLPPSPPVPPVRAPLWRWCIHLAIVAVLPVFVGVYGSVARGNANHPLSLDHPAAGHNASDILRVAAFEIGVFALIYAGTWFVSRATRQEMLLKWRPGFWVLPLGLVYSVALRLVVGLIAVIGSIAVIASGTATAGQLQNFVMANRPKVEAIVSIASMRNDPLYFWLMLTLVSFVLAGLREELWRGSFLAAMRGVWPRAFSGKGEYAAVAVGALIFGFGHLPQGIMAVALTALLGLGLGIIMVAHRSIWPAVITHGFFDAASFALLPWAAEKMKEALGVLG